MNAITKATRDRKWLQYVRELPCLLCRRPSSYPHHLLRTGERGMSMRSPDRYAVPLCGEHHRQLHDLGDERAFFFEHGIDPYKWVRDSYLCFHAPGIAGEQYGRD